MAFLIWRRSRGKVENKENNRLAAIAHVLCDSKRKVQCLCGHQIAIISQTKSQHRQNKQRNFTKKSSVYRRNESTWKQPNGATKIPNKLRFIRLASNFSLFVGSWSRMSSSAGAATTSSRSWTTSSAMVNRWKIAASVFFDTLHSTLCRSVQTLGKPWCLFVCTSPVLLWLWFEVYPSLSSRVRSRIED